VVGLSFEYQLFNVIGFSCYSTFNLMMRYSEDVRQQYRNAHDGNNNKVQDADVFFAIHGLALTFVTVAQIFLYDRGSQTISRLALV
jgi:cystinosin